MGDEALEGKLQEISESVGGTKRLTEELESVNQVAMSHLETGLLSGHIQISEDPAVLAAMIPHLQQKHPSLAYEDHVREHRLKEALRMKQELEQKLEYISETINVMSTNPELLESKKKEERPAKAQSEEEKRKESAEFAKKLMEQQKELQRRREAQIAKIATELQAREAEDAKRREDFEKKQADDREKRLKSLQEKARARADYLREMKDLFEKQSVQKPVEKQNSKEEVLFPELEKRKLDVMQRRQMTQEELKEHMRKYQERLKSEKERRERERAERVLTDNVNSAVYTKSYISALDEEKKRKEALSHLATEKQLAMEKQRRYADLVKEMYFPAIDKRKVEELQALKAQMTTEKRLPREKPTDRHGSVGRQLTGYGRVGISAERKLGSAVSDGDVQRPLGRPPVMRRKKGATSPQRSPEKPPEKPATVDYLGQQRKTQAERMKQALQRFQSAKIDWDEELRDTSLPEAEKYSKIRQKLSQIEEQARKNEALLSRVDVTSTKGLEAEAGVNDMIISTIKAKLALLQS